MSQIPQQANRLAPILDDFILDIAHPGIGHRHFGKQTVVVRIDNAPAERRDHLINLTLIIGAV